MSSFSNLTFAFFSRRFAKIIEFFSRLSIIIGCSGFGQTVGLVSFLLNMSSVGSLYLGLG